MAVGHRKYWEKPDTLALNPAYWSDPHHDWQGMLSSDQIALYQSVVGTPGMIDPFDLDNLKAAAYELTLGPNYLLEGEEGTLTDDNPWLELPPNSIVFVSMQERLIIPHYLVARFDLAIEFIYQGILLGTGPQVDPGFQGVLSCPLHNISNSTVHLQLGYPFAKIDFAKSSGLHEARIQNALKGILSEDDLYNANLPGVDGKPVKLFNRGNRWRQPIYAGSYAGQKRVRSSLSDLANRITAFGVEITRFDIETSRLRRFGLAGAAAVLLAVIAVLVTLAQLDRSYTDAKFDSATRRALTTNSQQALSLSRVRTLEREIVSLQRQVAALRNVCRVRTKAPC